MKRESALFGFSFILSVFTVLLLTQILFPGFGNVSTADQSSEVQNSQKQDFFDESAADIGLNYTGTRLPHHDEGIYIADLERDGFRDVLLLGGEEPKLYANEEGDMSLERSFDLGDSQVKSAHFFEYTDDNLTDLVLFLRGEKPVFYENKGGRLLRDDSLIGKKLRNPESAVSADFTGNGCSDLFIAQRGDTSVSKEINFYRFLESRTDRDYGYPRIENGGKNYLFEGSCGGGFEDVSQRVGLEGREWSTAVSAVDINGDGRTDIHVANDFGQDSLYINNGDGFRKREMGEDSNRHGMSSTIADFNGDLKPDIFVTNIYPADRNTSIRSCYIRGRKCLLGAKNFRYRNARNLEGNNLFINGRGASFEDRAREYGVRNGGWGWAASATDFTNNGYIDLVQANKGPFSLTELDEGVGSYGAMRFWEGGPGSFEQRDPEVMGLPVGNEKTLARLDVDRDGCMDIITTTNKQDTHSTSLGTWKFKLYQNTACDKDSYIQVDLRREDGERIRGTEVILSTDSREIYRVRNGRNNYKSQNSRLIHFGLKDGEAPERLEIKWPDGDTRISEDIKRGGQYVFYP